MNKLWHLYNMRKKMKFIPQRSVLSNTQTTKRITFKSLTKDQSQRMSPQINEADGNTEIDRVNDDKMQSS